ncbi:hypothetical protein [Teredinibacter purpureus]|uniref:hypothetical protein n=1 Tax=Teredinibacter purpureus TaxID=2731756 RepID=UPI0005F7B2D6|nr:hypothetical protein [Teredinibacter purpureus]
MQAQLETFEKLILHRNFRAALKGGESSFSPEHLASIHQDLCKGLEHQDKTLKSGELRVAAGAVSLLGSESNKIALNMMGSSDKGHISQRAAYAMQRIEQLQPFHSFNSLVGKLYSHNLAQTAGFRIDWPSIDKSSLKASLEESKDGNSGNLAKLIEANLKPMFDMESSVKVKDRLDSGFADRATSFVTSHGGSAEVKPSKLKVT